jgi:hypothetical protein
MSKTAELKNTKALVKHILEEDQKARNSDSYLYLKVIEHIADHKGFNLWELTVPYFLKYMTDYGFPPFESVRRTRQKLQAEYPELSANRKVAAQRAENEEAFRDFAREGGLW